MGNPEIYHFADYREYLNAVARSFRTARKRSFNLGTWSRRLGFRSPRSIAMILNGQRIPSFQMVGALCRDLKLNSDERRYLELLVLLDRARKSKKDPRPILEELERACARGPERFALDLDRFATISEWYYLVIRQLLGISGLRQDPASIAAKLRGKIAVSEVGQAVRTLLKLGLIRRDPRTSRLSPAESSVVTSQDIPSTVIRQHHTQMMERGQEALEEQPPALREMTSLTLRFDPAQIEGAKNAIRRFRDDFDQKFGSEGAREVFQLNVQFFSHTQREKEI